MFTRTAEPEHDPIYEMDFRGKIRKQLQAEIRMLRSYATYLTGMIPGHKDVMDFEQWKKATGEK